MKTAPIPRPKPHRFKGSLKAVDFFCGAGGMSYGLLKAGVQVLGGIDIDDDCQRTYEKNISGASYLKADVTKLTRRKLARFFGIKSRDDELVFCGCSPCQFWSKVNTDRERSEKTAFLLKHFERFIEYFRPGFVVVENVPGLLTKKKHSILPAFLEFLAELGYTYKDAIVDSIGHGVPQHRNRYLLVATRTAKAITLPKEHRDRQLTVRQFIGRGRKLKRLRAGQRDGKDPLHVAANLSPKNLSRLKKTPANGGDRSSWRRSSKLQLEAYRSKDEIFRDVYARMYWDRAAPTITTRFNSLSNGRFGHPTQNRAISLREGALLQTFPKSFSFFGSNQASIARQIGNAVPPRLARRIGSHLISQSTSGKI
jgi:DNA (cytosine-5)-methyltransferase 1